MHHTSFGKLFYIKLSEGIHVQMRNIEIRYLRKYKKKQNKNKTKKQKNLQAI